LLLRGSVWTWTTRKQGEGGLFQERRK
jgi:hypothetical protein